MLWACPCTSHVLTAWVQGVPAPTSISNVHVNGRGKEVEMDGWEGGAYHTRAVSLVLPVGQPGTCSPALLTWVPVQPGAVPHLHLPRQFLQGELSVLSQGDELLHVPQEAALVVPGAPESSGHQPAQAGPQEGIHLPGAAGCRRSCTRRVESVCSWGAATGLSRGQMPTPLCAWLPDPSLAAMARSGQWVLRSAR